MPIGYLEELERQILTGTQHFVCQGQNANEWIFNKEVETLGPKAQLTANSRKLETHLYRLINKKDAVTGDSFLVVRRFVGRKPNGTPEFEWSLVDTLESAEILRDVSHGPTPLFGAVIEQTFQPEK